MTATAEMNYLTCPQSGIEGKIGGDSTTNGEVTGYAAIFGVRDLDGDIIRPGSFKRSIDNQIQAGKVLLLVKHMRDGGDTTSAVGEIIEAKEDAIGLWIRCKLHATQQAQDIRAGVIESPGAYGMSVGWRDVQGGKVPLSDGMGFEYTEMNLKEVTLTLLPAQEDTIGTVRGKSEAQELRDLITSVIGRLDALEGKDVEEPEAAEAVASKEPTEATPDDASDDTLLDMMEMETTLLELERKSL
jgi:HK97 family phage prohead protease